MTLASLIFIESPYSGDIDRHVRYLQLYGFDAYHRGEMPCSSHGMMTLHPAKRDFFVSDYEPEWDVFTRDEAITRAHALRHACSKTIFYIDFGMSSGMKAGLEYCQKHHIPVEMRKLDVARVLDMKAQYITAALVKDILTGQPYQHHFRGTPLLPPNQTLITQVQDDETQNGDAQNDE